MESAARRGIAARTRPLADLPVRLKAALIVLPTVRDGAVSSGALPAGVGPASEVRTSSGLWRRRPQAHVVLAVLATPRTSPESLALIDPMMIRAQVAGGMRGL